MKSELLFQFDDTIEDEMARNRLVNADRAHRLIWDISCICSRYINGKNAPGCQDTAENEISCLISSDYPDFYDYYV
jgi:hypothetical protein